jgi:hypothetical protein
MFASDLTIRRKKVKGAGDHYILAGVILGVTIAGKTAPGLPGWSFGTDLFTEPTRQKVPEAVSGGLL